MSSKSTLHLDQVANHIQSVDFAVIFAIAHALHAPNSGPLFPLFRAFKTNMADAQKTEGKPFFGEFLEFQHAAKNEGCTLKNSEPQ